jgi:hypothetical protein
LALKDKSEEALLFVGSSRTTTPGTFVGMYLKIVEVIVLRRVSQMGQILRYGGTAIAYVVFGTIVTLRKELHIEMRDSMGTPIPAHCPVTWLAQLSPEHAATKFTSQASRAAPMIRPTCMIGNGMLNQFARGRQDNSASRNTVLIFPTIQRDVDEAFPLLDSPIEERLWIPDRRLRIESLYRESQFLETWTASLVRVRDMTQVRVGEYAQSNVCGLIELALSRVHIG